MIVTLVGTSATTLVLTLIFDLDLNPDPRPFFHPPVADLDPDPDADPDADFFSSLSYAKRAHPIAMPKLTLTLHISDTRL